ncbi:hypothetical protein DOTSEDRAFT_38539 [Dothistroma septosporum NZE10]|uniref:Uncharacterized protein n=1 Tax=Dothistroma septosporum (strain NZE10 / CBS 128990) TaxID=675120 RepID=M2WK63_DOTSN|nr:hypothetical protein DOTSEDRAFT_38539 [Dothistroma septosporum NZE10]
MQKIINETRAQLPDQPALPFIPQMANKTDASPPGHCGCEDELYTSEGCQCYKVVTSADTDLADGLKRGLKRKSPEEDDEMEDDFMCDDAVEEDRSPPAIGVVEKLNCAKASR